MKRIILLLLFLSLVFGSLYSQKKTTYKIINSNQLIVGTDTLIIDKTKITDILKQDEIDVFNKWMNSSDKLFSVAEESGEFTYRVLRGGAKLIFFGPLDDEFVLKVIKIFPTDQDSITFNGSVNLGDLNEQVLSDLDCYQIDKLNDSIFFIRRLELALKY